MEVAGLGAAAIAFISRYADVRTLKSVGHLAVKPRRFACWLGCLPCCLLTWWLALHSELPMAAQKSLPDVLRPQHKTEYSVQLHKA